MTFFRDAFLGGLIALGAAGAHGAPVLTSFGPTGSLRAVKQIHMTFSEDVVALGDSTAAPAASVQCRGTAEQPKGRWLDGRRWVAEFATELADGVVCDVQPLAAKGWRFDTGGPRLINILPGEKEVGEQHVLGLFSSAALDPATLKYLRCSVNGKDVPVKLLDAEASKAAALKLRGHAATGNQVYARCGEAPLPNYADLVWTWDKRIASATGLRNVQDELIKRHVRAPFSAMVSCKQVLGTPGCDPRHPVSVMFSAPLRAAQAAAMTLRDSAGTLFTDKYVVQYPNEDVRAAHFNPSFAAVGPLTPQWPATLADADGRTLTNGAQLLRPIQMAQLPPYVGMERGDGVVAWHPGATAAWPLVASGAVRDIKARSWRFGADTDSLTLLSLHAPLLRYSSSYGTLPAAPKAYVHSEAILAALNAPLPAPQDQEIGAAPAASGLLSIPLSGVGNWLVEADSAAQRAYLAAQHQELLRRQGQAWDVTVTLDRRMNLLWNGAPVAAGPDLARKLRSLGPRSAIRIQSKTSGQRGEFAELFDLAEALGLTVEWPEQLDRVARALDAGWRSSRNALVQLTNLHVHASMSGHGNSLLWITALDSGAPLANASVEVWSGDGPFERIASATSDAQGRVLLALDRRDASGSRPTHWVLVRLGADVAVSRIVDNAYPPYNGNLVPHTVLDRALFHPGETVSMAHVLRAPSVDGWAVPPDPALTLRIWRSDSGAQVHQQKLSWKADGTSDSSWPIPADMRLGEYSYALQQGGGSDLGPRGSFQIEEFRLPAFDASLTLQAAWLDERQVVRVTPGLSFLSGGAAAGQTTTISGTYSAGAQAPAHWQGYSFMDLESEPLGAAFPSTVLQLDAHGKAQADIAAPKQTWPLTLTAEMQFTDANGETQTHAARTAVWPQRHKLGITVSRSVAAGTLSVAVAALDEHDAPLAGASVNIDGAEFYTDWGRILPIAPDERHPICSVKTGADGKGRCDIAWTRGFTKAGWLFRARANAMSSASTALYYFAPREAAKPILERVASALPHAGQTDRLRIRAPFLPATLLLSVEREGVLASQTHTLSAAVEEIDLPTEARYAPGVSVVATFSRGVSQLPLDAPADAQLQRSERMTLMFDAADKRLDVVVTPALAEARPGAQVPVTVTVRRPLDGKPAAGASVILIAVDDALALLKPNTSTELLEHFWFSRGHDTTATDLAQWWRWRPFDGFRPDYMPKAESEVLMYGSPFNVSNPFQRMRRLEMEAPMPMAMSSGPLAAPPMQRAEIGQPGMAPLAPMPAAPPRVNFSTLALWQAHVVLDQHGQARVTLPLPDSLTRWRIVAIASAGTDMYGKGEAVLVTSKPFEIVSGLPLTVRGGDLVQQQITVRNTSRSAARVSLHAQAGVVRHPDLAQPAKRDLDQTRSLTLAAGESRVLTWPLAVPDGAIALAWKMTLADAASGAVLDALELTQTVVLQAPLTVRDSTTLAVGDRKSLAIAPQDGFGAVVVRWQDSLATSAVKGARSWMADYPYGCFEQRSSVAAALGERARWDQVMATLPRHLDHGLVRYFPETKGSEMLTAYVLSLARAYQLPIPAQQKTELEYALRQRLAAPGSATNDWLPDGGELNLRLAMQAALGNAQSNSAPTVPPELGKLPTEALLDWASYLLDTSATAQRDERLQQAASELRNRYEMHGSHFVWRNGAEAKRWWMMWTSDAVSARTALLLQRWQAVNPIWRDELVLLPQAIADQQHNGRWSTTVGNAYGVAALQRFMRAGEQGPVSGVSSATLAGQVRSSSWPEAASVQLPLPQSGNPTLVLEHKGSGAPWANVSVLAALKPVAPVVHGLAVEKSVTAVQQRVPGRWSVGDVIKVSLTMHAEADLGWVVVHDPIPSGATILGKGLAREGELVQQASGLTSWWQPGSVERGSDSFRGYYERVWTGSWSTDYLVRLNNAGRFGLPATRVEAMYAPEIFGEAPNLTLEVAP